MSFEMPAGIRFKKMLTMVTGESLRTETHPWSGRVLKVTLVRADGSEENVEFEYLLRPRAKCPLCRKIVNVEPGVDGTDIFENHYWKRKGVRELCDLSRRQAGGAKRYGHPAPDKAEGKEMKQLPDGDPYGTEPLEGEKK
jgi:hypothetical protein